MEPVGVLRLRSCFASRSNCCAQDDKGVGCHEQDIAEKDRRLHRSRDRRIGHWSIANFSGHPARTLRTARLAGLWGAPENTHYSSLKQINRENVKQLQVAWRFDTGESGGLQTSPIIVGDVLYAYSPSQKVIALNAATGKLLWKFDPARARMAARPRPGLLERWQGKAHPRRHHEFGLCARCRHRKTDLNFR